MKLQVQPEEVRKARKLTNGQMEVLIKWVDLPECDSTWESYDIIDSQFPHFLLKDKVKLVREDTDGPAVIRTYNQRQKEKNEREKPMGEGDPIVYSRKSKRQEQKRELARKE